MDSGCNLLDSFGNSDMCHKQVVVIKMDTILTKEERKRIVNELREDLLLALRYARGENVNLIRVGRCIRDGLDKLSEIEEGIIWMKRRP